MKNLAIGGALSLISGPAFAGVMPEELTKPTVLMVETTTDSTAETS